MVTSIAVITVESTGKAYHAATHDVLSLLLLTAACRRGYWVNKMEHCPTSLVFVFKPITIVTSTNLPLCLSILFSNTDQVTIPRRSELLPCSMRASMKMSNFERKHSPWYRCMMCNGKNKIDSEKGVLESLCLFPQPTMQTASHSHKRQLFELIRQGLEVHQRHDIEVPIIGKKHTNL